MPNLIVNKTLELNGNNLSEFAQSAVSVSYSEKNNNTLIIEPSPTPGSTITVDLQSMLLPNPPGSSVKQMEITTSIPIEVNVNGTGWIACQSTMTMTFELSDPLYSASRLSSLQLRNLNIAASATVNLLLLGA